MTTFTTATLAAADADVMGIKMNYNAILASHVGLRVGVEVLGGVAKTVSDVARHAVEGEEYSVYLNGVEYSAVEASILGLNFVVIFLADADGAETQVFELEEII